MKFEWNSRKAASNLAKHRIPFSEAITVFADPSAYIFDDEDHSIEEQREIIIGHSEKRRLLLVCFTASEDLVRIFSARKATRREKREYEETSKT